MQKILMRFLLTSVFTLSWSATNATELDVYKCSKSSQPCDSCEIALGGKVKVVPKEKNSEVLVQYPNGHIVSLKGCRFISNTNWDCSQMTDIGPFKSHDVRTMKNGILRWETYWQNPRPPGEAGIDSYWCFK